MNQQEWWELHLRKARGETLSDGEQRAYQDELARHEEQSPPLLIDLPAFNLTSVVTSSSVSCSPNAGIFSTGGEGLATSASTKFARVMS